MLKYLQNEYEIYRFENKLIKLLCNNLNLLSLGMG
jgi:hypothetical protein